MRVAKLLTIAFALSLLAATPLRAQAQPATEPALEEAPGQDAAPQPAPTPNQAEDAQKKPAPEKPRGFGDSTFIILLFAVLFLLYWWSARGRRKQEAKRRQMLAAMEKGQKVTTIGGIQGSIVEVREDEVIVKVDENVRLRFIKGAIREVGETKPEGKEK